MVRFVPQHTLLSTLMNLNRILSLGTCCLTCSCTIWNVATRPSMAQLQPDFSFLHVDPLDGFEELTIEPISPIATTFEECLVNPNAIFVISKRGGLADDPTQTLRDRTLWNDLRPLETPVELDPIPPRNESEPADVTSSPNTDRADLDFQKCQDLFDNR